MASLIRGLRRDHRGSGIVTVLVCMLLVVALGAALLFTSYVGLKIKLSDRSGVESFYSAETAMTEIRAGVQQAVTTSIADAYSKVLLQYNTAVDTEAAFHNNFKTALFAWSYTPLSGTAQPLFTALTEGGELYNRDVLRQFLSTAHQSSVSLDGCGAAVTVSGTAVTLENVAVSYTDSKGYETAISADITISLPDFTYSMNEYALTGIPEFALIANVSLTHNSGGKDQLVLTGNAYAGQVDLLNFGRSSLTVTGGTLISGGDVTVAGPGFGDGARLTVADDATLWAKRIAVETGSSLRLAGNTYVQDDLELAGDDSVATLSGRYYGFGYLESASGEAEQSSAIVINGQHTNLDLSGLRTLMLAGLSFVDTGEATDVLMGQSVSVKSDQIAYLAPTECLPEGIDSNPYFFTGDLSFDKDAVDYSAALWTVGGVKKTLGDYVSGVRVVTYNLASAPGARVAYFYLQFATKEKANRYFTDYFETHQEEITRYLKVYSETLTGAASFQSSGTAYSLAEDGTLSLIPAVQSQTLGVSAARLAEMYQNLCVTLSASVKSSGTATSPYNYVVRESDIAQYLAGSEGGISEFKDESGKTLGLIVTNPSFSIDAAFKTTYPDVTLVISTGDVNVDTTFSGLIAAKGTVTMNASLNADRELVSGALKATIELTVGGVKGKYPLQDFTVLGAGITGQSGSSGGKTDVTSSWDVDKLVTYQNWKKS
ncbi:MAG: hypothetical protein VB055_09880 [Oscillospiraceae bacterium]|nr:hypothetical protein [Oscillospiraceae bacterium]